jgi:hypothetical protein
MLERVPQEAPAVARHLRPPTPETPQVCTEYDAALVESQELPRKPKAEGEGGAEGSEE